MTEVGGAVNSLVFESGKASPEMTHSLKVLGSGDMQTGIKRLAAFFMEEGRERGYICGEKNGIFKGIAGTLFVGSLVAGGYYIAEQYKMKKLIKAHVSEGKKIIHVLKKEEPEIIESEEVEQAQKEE